MRKPRAARGAFRRLKVVTKNRTNYFSHHDRSADAITPDDWTSPPGTPPFLPLACHAYRHVYAVARARAALGYADERQIKMHNPGKSFRIFHNGREISLLAARAIHPYVQPRSPPLAQSPREFVGDRALRAHTNGRR
ncbi:hypothetical protein PUN28_009201 [Cardiocondyla obscurior]|uniref:Uncharacterized protein n=1 Tax=Cardiocondyla obscurior TaxID=286306 RepID=A0AAW2FRE2_9HYME